MALHVHLDVSMVLEFLTVLLRVCVLHFVSIHLFMVLCMLLQLILVLVLFFILFFHGFLLSFVLLLLYLFLGSQACDR